MPWRSSGSRHLDPHRSLEFKVFLGYLTSCPGSSRYVLGLPEILNAKMHNIKVDRNPKP